MSLILNQIFKFFKLLNSDTGANQLAAGISCGLVLGFSPFVSLQSLLILVVIFLFRVQMGAAFLAAFFFKFAAYLIDPLAHQIGLKVLKADGLKDIWTELYNMPLVPLTRFNNTVVMGSGIIALFFLPEFFLLLRYLILKYREKIVARFRETKIWKIFSATFFYKWYSKYDQLYR